MDEIVGGLFRALTVKTKLVAALNCPSVTVTVDRRRARPVDRGRDRHGATRSTAPEHDTGEWHQRLIRRASVNVKLPTAVSRSPTVKPRGPTAVPAVVV